MAAARVQHLGAANLYTSGGSFTTAKGSLSKTVTVGDVIIVGFFSNGTVSTGMSVTDNLGNSYSIAEVYTDSAHVVSGLFYAPITVGGTLTTITVAHPNSKAAYRSIIASEYSGVGTLAAAGDGTVSSSVNLPPFVANKTIPANGLAIGVVGEENSNTETAGAASGNPSTATVKDTFLVDYSNLSIGLFYAVAGETAVTGFSGNVSHGGTGRTATAGGLFNPAAAAAAVSPNFIPFFWA